MYEQLWNTFLVLWKGEAGWYFRAVVVLAIVSFLLMVVLLFDPDAFGGGM